MSEAAVKSNKSADEVVESLNGFDEEAIVANFGQTWEWMSENRATTLIRALAFIELTRAGQKAGEAKKAVMGWPISAVKDYFSDDAEPMPEEPITPGGKDDSLPE